MARLQRKHSNTGCYHVMLRGNERKNIFHDDQDRLKFIDILRKKQLEAALSFYAYCLMNNHVHLILKDELDEISLIMKGMATSYAMYFNNKYERVGHVFQDRFKSEVVEDERHLMAVIRYVHHNPIKARIVDYPQHYKWSSYQWYMDPDAQEAKLVDTQYILGMIAENRDSAISVFKRFFMEENDDEFLDDDEGIYIKDRENFLVKYLNENWKGITLDSLRENKKLRSDIITDLRTNKKLSIRSIATLLDINRGIVERANKTKFKVNS